MTPTRTPISAPSAWRPSDFPGPEAYTVALTDAHLAAFDAALGMARAHGRGLENATAGDFALDAIAADLAAWRDEVLRGRGFIVLRELDDARYTPDELATTFWGLGLHLGRAVSQSPMGDRLGHVTDVGGQDRRERAYRSSRELTMHTDRCDVVGMLCLRKAMRGGVSAYASAHTVYNEILATRAALLDPLFTGLRYHRGASSFPVSRPLRRYPFPSSRSRTAS